MSIFKKLVGAKRYNKMIGGAIGMAVAWAIAHWGLGVDVEVSTQVVLGLLTLGGVYVAPANAAKAAALALLILTVGCASPIVQAWCGKIVVSGTDVFPCVEEAEDEEPSP